MVPAQLPYRVYISSISNQSSVSAISISKWYRRSYHIQCIISSISNQQQQMVHAQLPYPVYYIQYQQSASANGTGAVTISSILYPVSAISISKRYSAQLPYPVSSAIYIQCIHSHSLQKRTKALNYNEQ